MGPILSQYHRLINRCTFQRVRHSRDEYQAATFKKAIVANPLFCFVSCIYLHDLVIICVMLTQEGVRVNKFIGLIISTPRPILSTRVDLLRQAPAMLQQKVELNNHCSHSSMLLTQETSSWRGLVTWWTVTHVTHYYRKYLNSVSEHFSPPAQRLPTGAPTELVLTHRKQFWGMILR